MDGFPNKDSEAISQSPIVVVLSGILKKTFKEITTNG